MANVLINEDTMTNIADAIRAKKGVSTTYLPSEMPTAISSISGGGGITPTGTINITTNGTHDVTNYASANVAVPQGTTPTGTKEINITSNGTTTEDVTNYASAQITVNVPTGSTSFGADETNTLSELFYALEHNNYSTGTVTVSSYFPANVESEFCDTGFTDNVRGILIFNTNQPVSSSNSYDTYEALGFMGKPSSAGANQGISSVSGFTKVRNATLNSFLTATEISPRVNSGKLYITPTKAQSTYTFFHPNNTYRWIAWGYTS